MKVSFISTYKIRCGIATYSEFLTDELKKIADVKMFSLKKPASLNPFYWKWLAVKSYFAGDIIHVQFNYELFGRNSSFWTYINSMFFFYTLFFLNLFKRKPIILTIHEIFPETRKLVKITDKIYKKADVIIVHTEESKEALAKRGYKNIFIIPLGVYNKPIFVPRNIAKKKLGLEDKKILTMYGFINPFKNYEFIFELLPSLPHNYFLLIAGGCRIKEDEEYFKKISDMQKKFPERSRILGFVKDEDLPTIFNATDISLFPYKRTTQSGTLSETLSYRKPSVVMPLRAFEEINNKYSCLVVAKDKNDWIKKIKKIVEDSGYKNNLIKNIDRYYNDNNWTNIAKIHKITYEKTIKKN